MLSHMTFSKIIDVPKSNTTIIPAPKIECYVDLRTGTKKKCVKNKPDYVLKIC